jgi:preprotein translocase YajC subunit
VTQTTIWILYLAVFVGIFYFFIFRPQMNRQKEQMALMSSLAEGDRIVTAGGIFGSGIHRRSRHSSSASSRGSRSRSF